MLDNELSNILKIQDQIKKCDDFFGVVAEFQADGCPSDRAFDLACQLLQIEKTTGSFMTGTIKIKYKNNDEQCLNVVMPLEKNEYQIIKLVHKHLVSEIKASHVVNGHSSVKDLESLLPHLSYITFNYFDVEECKNKDIDIDTKYLLSI